MSYVFDAAQGLDPGGGALRPTWRPRWPAKREAVVGGGQEERGENSLLVNGAWRGSGWRRHGRA